MSHKIKCEFCLNDFLSEKLLIEHYKSCSFFKKNLILFDNSSILDNKKQLILRVKRLDTDEDINRVTHEYLKKVKETERKNKKNRDTAKSKVLKIFANASVADCTEYLKPVTIHSELLDRLVPVHVPLVTEVAEPPNRTNSLSAIDRLTSIKNNQKPQILENNSHLNQPAEMMRAPIPRGQNILHSFVPSPAAQIQVTVNNSAHQPMITQHFQPQHFVPSSSTQHFMATTPNIQRHQPQFYRAQQQPQMHPRSQLQHQPPPQQSIKILTPGELNNRVNNNGNGTSLNMDNNKNVISNKQLPISMKLAIIEGKYQLVFINQRDQTEIPMESLLMDKDIQKKILTKEFLSTLKKCVVSDGQNQNSYNFLAFQINKIFSGCPPPSLNFLF